MEMVKIETIRDLLKQAEKVSGLSDDDRRSLEYVRKVVMSSSSRSKDVMGAFLVVKTILSKSKYKPVEYYKILPYSEPGFVSERDLVVISWEHIDRNDNVFGHCSIGKVLRVDSETVTVDVFFSSEDGHLLDSLPIRRKGIRSIYRLSDVFKFANL